MMLIKKEQKRAGRVFRPFFVLAENGYFCSKKQRNRQYKEVMKPFLSYRRRPACAYFPDKITDNDFY